MKWNYKIIDNILKFGKKKKNEMMVEICNTCLYNFNYYVLKYILCLQYI